MSEKMAFRMAVLAAVVMLGVGAVMGVTAPPCRPLPEGLSPLTAFELARSAADLTRLFGTPGEMCRALLVAQLDHANAIDAAAYIPVYALFYGLVLFALGRRDGAIGWIGVAVVVACAAADWVENAGMFHLGAAPDDAGSVWLPTLVVATNIKWVGLALATTLCGVMLWRRGGLGWLAFFPCAAPLASSIGAIVTPDVMGRYLVPGMAVASVMLLLVAIRGSLPRKAPVGG